MLSSLLELLREGGTRRVSELARELKTTPALVETMLEDLTRMGYLSRVAGGCSGRCDPCPLSRSCATGEGKRVWALTQKAQSTGGGR